MKFLMHQKVILVFVVLIFGAFPAVKFSFWFIVIPSVFSIFIFRVCLATILRKRCLFTVDRTDFRFVLPEPACRNQ